MTQTKMAAVVGRERMHREKGNMTSSDLDEDLEDEDYELIEENLGIKVQRVSSSFTEWFNLINCCAMLPFDIL